MQRNPQTLIFEKFKIKINFEYRVSVPLRLPVFDVFLDYSG